MNPPALCADPNCPSPSHDTYSSYRWGCRSEAARADNRRYNKRLGTPLMEVRRVPSLGPRRRLQALAALGHTWLELADELGVTWYRVSRIARGVESPEWMLEVTAKAISDVYERLSMVPGSNNHSRSRARNRGWVPPLAYDDVDDPHERPKLGTVRPGNARWNSDEVRAAVARRTRLGESALVIAQALGVSERSVVRIRAEQRADEEAA